MGEDDEDEDDFLADDPMAFIERQDSEQVDVKNLFEDDPKAKARREVARAANKRAGPEEKKEQPASKEGGNQHNNQRG